MTDLHDAPAPGDESPPPRSVSTTNASDPFSGIRLQCKYPDLFKAICEVGQCAQHDWASSHEWAAKRRHTALQNAHYRKEEGALHPDDFHTDEEYAWHGFRHREIERRMDALWDAWRESAHADRHYTDEERRNVTDEDYRSLTHIAERLGALREYMEQEAPPHQRAEHSIRRFAQAADHLQQQVETILGYRQAAVSTAGFTPDVRVHSLREATPADGRETALG